MVESPILSPSPLRISKMSQNESQVSEDLLVSYSLSVQDFDQPFDSHRLFHDNVAQTPPSLTSNRDYPSFSLLTSNSQLARLTENTQEQSKCNKLHSSQCENQSMTWNAAHTSNPHNISTLESSGLLNSIQTKAQLLEVC